MRPLKDLIDDVKKGIITVRTYNEYAMLCAEVWHALEALKSENEALNRKLQEKNGQ